MSTALVWHELYMWHDTGHYAGILPPGTHLQPGEHWENPESKRRIKNLLDASGLLKRLHLLEPIPITDEQLLRVHTGEYLQQLTEARGRSGDAGGLTPFGAASLEIARLSAGAVTTLANSIMDGQVDNGYSLNRPPGHHALPGSGMGFCMLSNAAIAAHDLMVDRGLSRIAFIDWDVHHGNGAEAIFWRDPRVLTISIHQDRCFPLDTGHLADNGGGSGAGTNINIPLPAGSGRGAYLAAFDRVILPALAEFQPEFIIVPSGFDAGAHDPLGRMMLHSTVYGQMTQRLKTAAQSLCNGRILFCHEGGYNPYTTPYCALAVIEALSGEKSGYEDPFEEILSAMGGQELQPHQDEVVRSAEALIKRLN